MGDTDFGRSRAANAVQLMHVRLTCKYEQGPMKNEGPGVATPLLPFYNFTSMGIFPDAQAQSMVGTGRNSNSFMISDCSCYLQE